MVQRLVSEMRPQKQYRISYGSWVRPVLIRPVSTARTYRYRFHHKYGQHGSLPLPIDAATLAGLTVVSKRHTHGHTDYATSRRQF